MQKKPRPKPRPKKIKKTAVSSTPPWAETKDSFAEKQNEGAENGKEEYEKLNKKYQFLMAEYANYKKHSMKQLADLRKYEGQFLIQKLIDSVVDDFDRAMTQNLTENNIEEFRKRNFNDLREVSKPVKRNRRERACLRRANVRPRFTPCFRFRPQQRYTS